MTREQAEQRARVMLDTARTIGLKSGHVVPAFEVIPHAGPPLVMLVPFESVAQKHAGFDMVTLACLARDAEAVIFVSECWISQGPLPAGVTPGTSDTRTEGLQAAVSYYTSTGAPAHFFITQEILRGDDGAWVGVGAERVMDGVKGTVTEILPPERATAAGQAAAQAVLMRLSGMQTDGGETVQ